MVDILTARILNPDHYLQTESGRCWTPERSRQAWDSCFEVLRQSLSGRAPPPRVVVVCGLQGSGKSTWVAHQPSLGAVIYFDAALPARRHRRPIVEIAKAAGAPIEVVWIDVLLDVALERNALRPSDLRVPEASIRSVAKLFETPTTLEGFERVRVVRDAAAAHRHTTALRDGRDPVAASRC